ncbi:MAG: DUF58 domain-containing protein [Chloroflexota bacterium]|nr:DUF58 domain-containing protein [Chloroflexota bacterium]
MRRLVFIVLLLLSLMLALSSGFLPMSVLAIVIGVSFIVSYIWNKLSLKGLRVRIERTSNMGHVGQEVDRLLWIENHSFLPRLWVQIKSTGNLTGIKPLVVGVSGRASRTWHRMPAILQNRGRYDWGDVIVSSGDPLGLFTSHRRINSKASIVVHPRVVDIDDFALSSIDPGSDSSEFLSSSDVTPNVVSVRRYNSGDSMNHIHWVSSARMNQLMVKEFELEVQNDLWIILDLNAKTHFGAGFDGTEETAVTVAASISNHFIKNNNSVGLIGNDSQEHVLPPRSGDRQLSYIFEYLAACKADGDEPINNMLLKDTSRVNRQAGVVVITTSETDGILAATNYLSSRSAPGAVVSLDLESFKADQIDNKEYKEAIDTNIPIYSVTKGGDLSKSLRFENARPFISERVIN